MRNLSLDRAKYSSVTGGVLPFREFEHSQVCDLSTSVTSIGNQKKYKTLDGEYYIKGRYNHFNGIREDNLVEAIASKYASLCHFPEEVQVVQQGLCSLSGKRCSYSQAFDKEGTVFISFYRALGSKLQVKLERSLNHASGVTTVFPVIRDLYSELVGMDCTEYLLSMMLLDVIVGNEDRHLNNFGYVEVPEGQLLEPSPLFDFGLGLFEGSDFYNPRMPLLKATRKVRIKPWDAKAEKILFYLKCEYPDFISHVLPSEVRQADFEFPSQLAKQYFMWANQSLGVETDWSD